MDDELCCICGKLTRSGRLYCSEACQEQDLSSSNSSPHISPRLDPLLAVKGGLRSFSSSSGSSFTSSVSSLLDDTTTPRVSIIDRLPSAFAEDSDHGSKSRPKAIIDATINYATRPPAMAYLNYNRRPSQTNNQSTIPLFHHRGSPSSPIKKDHPPEKKHLSRASLPAYFSRLKISPALSNIVQSPPSPLAQSNNSTPTNQTVAVSRVDSVDSLQTRGRAKTRRNSSPSQRPIGFDETLRYISTRVERRGRDESRGRRYM